MKLFVCLAFYYNPKIIRYLKQTIVSLRNLGIETKIIVDVNANSDHTRLNLSADVFVNPVRYLTDPFLLAWHHKHHMRDFLKGKYTHFAYLEPDHKLLPHHLQYWLDYRKFFLENNKPYLPGFIRYETLGKQIISSDFGYKQKKLNILIKGNLFYSVEQPYQGMFIMDKELVHEHLDSPASCPDKCIGIWGDIREAANSEYIYYRVPIGGVAHRLLIPAADIDACLVHHLSNKYAQGKPKVGSGSKTIEYALQLNEKIRPRTS